MAAGCLASIDAQTVNGGITMDLDGGDRANREW